MDLSGQWLNEYGSRLDVAEDGEGGLFGAYASHTGHSGRYLVCGATGEGDLDSETGVAVALSLFWRSLEGEADPSWHWVSAFSGQVTSDEDGVAELSCLHVLLTTTSRPGIPDPAAYVDKLRFRQQPGSIGDVEDLRGELRQGAAPDRPNRMEGTWAAISARPTSLTLHVVAATGLVEGSLGLDDRRFSVRGFTDVAAAEAGLALQSVALAGRLDGGRALVLVGSIAADTGLMTCTALTSRGTAPADRYLCTTTETLTFRPA